MRTVNGFVWLTFVFSFFAWAQSKPPTSVPTKMIVTMGHYYSHEPPVLTANDLTVTETYEPLTITSLTPLRGDRAGLEMFLLVDNCSTCEPGSKFTELQKFIGSQPSTTSVGVAYIQDGRLQIAEKPTLDRERAVKALSPPAGSKPADPFGALAELIEGWSPNSSRHVVLMISTGMDPGAAGGQALRSPSAEAAIQAAQRAGVTVYAIYHPSADYATADFSNIYSGQVLLSHVANETGGESYFLSFGPLPSLGPFLADISEHLANQYLLEFRAIPGETPGGLEEVVVKSKIHDVELMAPYKVVVAGDAAADQKSKAAPQKH